MIHSNIVIFSLLFICSLLLQSSSAQNKTPFPQSVIRHMATRHMRYHHYLWHQVRDNWHSFSESTKQAFRNIDWEPPNPTRDNRGNRIEDNYAGEDFLYMHRQMIVTANQIIAENKEPYGRIRGWTTIPAPEDIADPVPPPYQRGSDSRHLESYKTNDYYNSRIKTAEQRMKDPARLRRMTLNELGLELESGLHNAMHMRWAASSPVGYRGGGGARNGVPDIDKRWDDVRYNWLVDSYSSHVNPLFWSLHGWIDDRVEDWRRANGLTTIRWRGTWRGGPMSSLSSVMKVKGGRKGAGGNDGDVGDVLKEGLNIFLESGIEESSPETMIAEAFKP